MANITTSRVKILGLNPQVLDKLKELFPSSGGPGQIDTNKHLEKLFGDEFTQNPGPNWMDSHLGVSRIDIEYMVSDDMSEILLSVDTPYSFPDKWLEKLSQVLTEIHPKVSLLGTYEDERVEPMGAFVFGLDYSDWEELEVDIDYDVWYDDLDYRDEVFGELYSLRDDLYDAYLIHMEDIGEEV